MAAVQFAWMISRKENRISASWGVVMDFVYYALVSVFVGCVTQKEIDSPNWIADPWLTQKSTLCPICKYDCMPPDRACNDDSRDQHGESSHAAAAATAGAETNNLLRGENHDSSVELQQIVVTHPTEQQQQHPAEQSPPADNNNNNSTLTTTNCIDQSSTSHSESDNESSIHKDTPTENNSNHNRHS